MPGKNPDSHPAPETNPLPSRPIVFVRYPDNKCEVLPVRYEGKRGSKCLNVYRGVVPQPISIVACTPVGTILMVPPERLPPFIMRNSLLAPSGTALQAPLVLPLKDEQLKTVCALAGITRPNIIAARERTTHSEVCSSQSRKSSLPLHPAIRAPQRPELANQMITEDDSLSFSVSSAFIQLKV